MLRCVLRAEHESIDPVQVVHRGGMSIKLENCEIQPVETKKLMNIICLMSFRSEIALHINDSKGRENTCKELSQSG